ncbi:MAG: redoxin domain-containing protein [Planctomycetota bacterium]|nr:redoxin domain-containing protein [Planctomycetota bacterium]
MTMSRASTLLSATIISVLSATVMAQDAPTLKPGSSAPKPDIEHWVKGGAPEFFESGTVYVVEFWATWCGPCKASMPHLTELQKNHPEVVIVGISDEKLETVEPFINSEAWAAKTGYRIATDPDRSVYDAYMKASGQRGIPTAFIVGTDGVVEWIGHPMRMDEPLEQIIAGTFDREASAKAAEEEAKRRAEERQALTALRVEQTKLAAAMEKGMSDGDWTEYCEVADAIIAKAPPRLGLSLGVQKFKMLVGPAAMPTEGYAFGEALLPKLAGNAQSLNEIAWYVVDDGDVATRNLDFAMKAAVAADDAAEHKDGSIVDTLARVYWEKGDRAKAIELQTKAVELAKGSPMEDDIKEMLVRYKASVEKSR